MGFKTMVLIVGVSGSGKTTIAERCEKDYGLKVLKSYTTRPQRFNGESGHIFVSKKEFDNLQDKVAYVKYDNNEYCATASQIEKNDIYVIDPKGINYLKEKYKGDKNLVSVFLTASSDPHEAFNICYERMKSRGDSVESAANRVAIDNHEFKDYYLTADYVYVNKNCDDIDKICRHIKEIIEGGEAVE